MITTTYDKIFEREKVYGFDVVKHILENVRWRHVHNGSVYVSILNGNIVISLKIDIGKVTMGNRIALSHLQHIRTDQVEKYIKHEIDILYMYFSNYFMEIEP